MRDRSFPSKNSILHNVIKKEDTRQRIVALLNSLDDYELDIVNIYLSAERAAREHLNKIINEKKGFI